MNEVATLLQWLTPRYREVGASSSPDAVHLVETQFRSLHHTHVALYLLIMKNKFKVNDIVSIGDYLVEITIVDKFGSTPHYGIMWDKVTTGWIPCEVLDNVGQRHE